MGDDTSQGTGEAREGRRGELDELGLPREKLVRRGVRKDLNRAAEAKVPVLFDEVWPKCHR